MIIVRNGSSSVQHIDANFAETVREGPSTKGGNRNLTRDWFFRTLPNGENVLRSWMVYSPAKKSLFCFCCRLFSDSHSSTQSTFASQEGFNKWWKMNPKVEEHESGASHNRLFLKWKELEFGLASGSVIDQREQRLLQQEVKKWREVFSRILDIIKYLAKQNMAFRGHRESVHQLNSSGENQGNFLELVKMMSKYDPVLREHLSKADCGKNNLLYLSPKIQNEFINILGENVRKIILNQIKDAKYFAVIFDSTPDCSHKDQMSEVIRYVSISGKKVEIKESFIDFIEMDSKNAEGIANLILGKLEKDEVDIQDCRGQAYDNASVMSGKLLLKK